MEKNHDSSSIAELISLGRGAAMGFATICIILFHQPFVPENSFFTFMNLHGYWGVDIFLLLSGFGIFHALQKSSESNNVWRFYGRRLLRLMPPAIIAGGVIVLLNPFFDGRLVGCRLPFGLTNFSVISGLHLWYIRAILLFYALSPLLFVCLKRHRLLLIPIILGSWCLGLVLCSHYQLGENDLFYKSAVWPLLRFPTYIIGMALGAAGHLRARLIPISGLALFCAYWAISWRDAHTWSLLVLPPVGLAICLLFGKLAKTAHTIKACHILQLILQQIGTYSLEVYLLNMAIYLGVRYYYARLGWDALILALLILGVAVVLLHWLTKLLTRLLLTSRS